VDVTQIGKGNNMNTEKLTTEQIQERDETLKLEKALALIGKANEVVDQLLIDVMAFVEAESELNEEYWENFDRDGYVEPEVNPKTS